MYISKFLPFLFLLVLAISCSSPTPNVVEVTRNVPQTVVVQQTVVVTQLATVLVTQLATVIVTATPVPATSTPTVTPTP